MTLHHPSDGSLRVFFSSLVNEMSNGESVTKTDTRKTTYADRMRIHTPRSADRGPGMVENRPDPGK